MKHFSAPQRLAGIVLLGLACGAALNLRAQSNVRAIDEGRFLAHVKFLASDELQGRGNGTPGLEKAAEYIAAEFRKAGLSPAGDDGTYFQGFEIVTGIEAGRGNTLRVRGPGGETSLTLGEDYYPVSIEQDRGGAPSASGPIPLVFAGYGISDPGNGYDEYARADVKGKAVLVFTHEPQENDPSSRFAGRASTPHASVLTKAMQARKHGARLLIVVDDPTHPVTKSRYHGFTRDPQAESYGLPVVQVRRDALQPLLSAALDLDEVHADIDRDLVARTQELQSLRVDLQEQYTRVRRRVRNVVGALRGGSKPDEAVVVGAHYDHLGLGGRHSLSSDNTGEIHNGADDNASGTAALMEIAYAAAGAMPPPRTLVFAAFAAEEIGLLGSSHYVSRPTIPLDRTIAMVNLDMIGRPGGRVLISGFEKAPSLEADLAAAQKDARTRINVRRFSEGSAGVGASDDSSFVLRRVPALAFFSGFHSDYHGPGDDWDKLEIPGAVEVTRLAAALAQRIAARETRPEFVSTAIPAHGGAAPAGTSVGGYGAYFGSVPDFADEGAGVRFADVREGSPAAIAGLRRGDVLIRFDGSPIKTLYDFTFALREKRAGERVDVVVLRDGKELTASVELGNRP